MVESPRAEDVKKSLERWERSQRGLSKAMSFSDIEVVAAAAREWLASQEQTPDYEVATELLNAEMRYYEIDFEFSEQQVEAVVDRALVGVHPQPEGESDATS